MRIVPNHSAFRKQNHSRLLLSEIDDPGFETSTIGFCLIRQSSASPIVCFHQSNQIPAHTSNLHWRAKALVGCVLNMERRRDATAAAFFAGDGTAHQMAAHRKLD